MFEWITGVVADSGYGGVFLLMLLENLFPPIPSELIMPLAGFAAARGDLNLFGVIAAGAAGSLAGTAPWYILGRAIGLERLKKLAARFGRWLTVTPDELQQAADLFLRFGSYAVFFGRLIPAVRTLISVPAGIARMPLPAFIFWTTLGTVLWTAVLTIAGYLFESQYERVEGIVDPVTKIVIALVVLVYLYRLVTFNRRHRRRAD